MIQYSSVVIFCSDINESKSFYQKNFGLEVELDIGALVTFKGGLSLWDAGLAKDFLYSGSEPSPAQVKPTSEIYFETDDINNLYKELNTASVRFLHSIETTPWQQQTIRFFDPDGHLIEVGESMVVVINRVAKTKKSQEKIAELTHMPQEYVNAVLSGVIKFPDVSQELGKN